MNEYKIDYEFEARKLCIILKAENEEAVRTLFFKHRSNRCRIKKIKSI